MSGDPFRGFSGYRNDNDGWVTDSDDETASTASSVELAADDAEHEVAIIIPGVATPVSTAIMTGQHPESTRNPEDKEPPKGP